jgi:proteasome lid subunit RPN8/RPN11
LSTPFHLHIPENLYQAMVAQALAESPNECCGLLGGVIIRNEGREAIGLVKSLHPLVNEAASPVEYLSDARSMFDAVRALRAQAVDLLAVYHSHPKAEPIPSRTDREQNYSEDVMNLIISLEGEAPRVRGWWLTADAHREAEWEVVGKSSQ